jgi:hypothetical protein
MVTREMSSARLIHSARHHDSRLYHPCQEKNGRREGRGCRWSGGNPFAAEREELLQKKILERLFDCLIELVHVLNELEGDATVFH